MAAVTATTAATQIPPLHPRLLHFFAKFPPQRFSAYATGQTIPTLRQRQDAGLTKALSAQNVPKAAAMPAVRSASTVNSSAEIVESSETTATALEHEATIAATPAKVEDTVSADPTPDAPFNPFLPRKVHATGKWRAPLYGLRVQADLFKLARQYGVEELLPPSIKSTEYKQRRALERGLAVRGTGEGERVKGHKWERQMATTVERRRKAMEEMPEMIRLWQERGHGRGWKKYPK